MRVTFSSLTSTPTSWAIPYIKGKAGITAVRSIEAVVATESILIGWFWNNALLMNCWDNQSSKDWMEVRTN